MTEAEKIADSLVDAIWKIKMLRPGKDEYKRALLDHGLGEAVADLVAINQIAPTLKMARGYASHALSALLGEQP